MKNGKKKRLEFWQDRVQQNKAAWESERAKMDHREALYKGNRELRPLVKGDKLAETGHVWNIVAENIESIINSTIPLPKVTARRTQDKERALIVEHMLLNEIDRLPMEELNDMQERTVPIQGGTGFLVEWDNALGEVSVRDVHPKLLIPQDGVYRSVDDMDFFAMMLPQTRESIRRQYGVDVSQEGESDPEAKGAGETGTAQDMVTQYVVYYKNDQGGIGKISWVNDVLLEDLEDYQARLLKRCAVCGAVENTEELILSRPTEDGVYPEGAETGKRAGKCVCPYCGGTKWEESREDYRELYVPVRIGRETVGGTVSQVDEYGNTVSVAVERVPYYKPDVFPMVLQRNVSIYGQLMGDSDVDKIADQQNTMNRMEQKIIDRLVKAGTRVSLPPDTSIVTTPEDGATWRLHGPEDKACIGVYEFSGNLQYEMTYLSQVYEESRRILGITDSFQGRQDRTATSGVAKQFAAQQSAGRMESKRVMKNAAYARLYERIFKWKLAYTDQPQDILTRDQEGNENYEVFDPMDFLERDDKGEWKWVDDFLFSVDDSGGMAGNRAKLWQELTAQLQMGALGNPQETDTLIDYWSAMEELHYPYAGKNRKRLLERRKRQMDAQIQAAQAQTAMQGEIPG